MRPRTLEEVALAREPGCPGVQHSQETRRGSVHVHPPRHLQGDATSEGVADESRLGRRTHTTDQLHEVRGHVVDARERHPITVEGWILETETRLLRAQPPGELSKGEHMAPDSRQHEERRERATGLQRDQTTAALDRCDATGVIDELSNRGRAEQQREGKLDSELPLHLREDSRGQ